MKSLVDPRDYMEGGTNSREDSAIRSASNREMERIQKEISKSLSELAATSSKINKGEKVNVDNINKAVTATNDAIKAYQSLIGIASGWLDRTAVDKINKFIKDAEQRIGAYSVFYINEQRKQQDADRKRRESEERAEEESRRNRERKIKAMDRAFISSNQTLIDQITESYNNVGGEIDKVIDQMTETNARYLAKSDSQRRDREINAYRRQTQALEDYLNSYEESYLALKDTLEKEEREAMEDRIADIKRLSSLSKKYYRDEMERNRSLGSIFVGELTQGMSKFELGMKTFKDIFDSINIGMISRTLLQGAENLTDVMSEISRNRGLRYSDVKGIRSGFGPGDTYGGYLNATDIMQVYRMTNLSTDTLKEIASTVAMFEKETGIGNETLNGMLLWMQNSGVSKVRTTEVLDYLQSIRDNGAPVEDLAAFISENASLVSGHEEEYAAYSGALRANGMNNIADMLDAVIANYNSVQGAMINNPNLSAAFSAISKQTGMTIDDLERMANSQDYGALVEAMVLGQDLEAGDLTTGPNVKGAVTASKFNMTPAEMAAFSELKDPLELIRSAVETMNEEAKTSTVASEAETSGYLGFADEIENYLSNTFVGEMATGISEVMRGHPVFTSIISGLANIATQAGGKAVGKWVSNAAASGGLGKAVQGLATKAGLGGAKAATTTATATEAATGGVTAATTTATATEAATTAAGSAVSALAPVAIGSAAIIGGVAAAKYFSDKGREKFINSAGDKKWAGRFSAEDIVNFYQTQSELGNDEIFQLGQPSTVANLIEAGWLNVDDTDNDGNIDSYKWAGKAFQPDSMSFNPDLGSVVDAEGNPIRPYKIGLSYVPYDGFLAELHKGERVLTSSQNEKYSETINRNLASSELSSVLSKLDNSDFQKIVKDGFEYIGRKIMEAAERTNTVSTQNTQETKKSLTSMYLANQW